MALVKLNVGETFFETSHTTQMSVPNSILVKKYNRLRRGISDSSIIHSKFPLTAVNGVFYFDTCPKAFAVVLNWLRYRKVMLRDNKPQDLIPVAEVFGLDELKNELHVDDDQIKVNVGGSLFKTTCTALRSVPDNLLAKMFKEDSDVAPMKKDGNDVFFVDACPHVFDVVLNWLRYRKVMLGDNKPQDVIPVAEFFGLAELKNELQLLLRRDEVEE